MSVEILTRQDLMLFKQDLIRELKQIFSKEQATQKKWLRTDEVRKLLKVSPGTLQNLRVKGVLQYTKVGGILFYDSDHIHDLLSNYKQQTKNYKP